jgi:hypothetical protein
MPLFLYVLFSASLLNIRQVPIDTRLHVRLTTAVGSYASRTGTPVHAVLIAPVVVEGETVLPAGTTLSGRVKSVRRVGLGIVHETAGIGLSFDRLKAPGGEEIPVSSRVEQVDNARERVTRDGRILGQRATASLSYRTGGYIRIFLQWQVHARLMTWAIKTLLVQVPESEIYYPAGVELTLSLTDKMLLNAPLQPEQMTHGLTKDEREDLAPLVSSMPYRTIDPASNRPADLVNLLFAGSRDQLDKAFVAAGWEEAHPASFRSRVRGMRAVADGRGYRAAPMSSLLLNQSEPNMSWQKGLNDFSKRHHIRVWSQPGAWQGQELWTGAATRDIGYAFLRQGLRLTHRIDANIDDERAKIADDLAFTSCVDLVDFIDRPGIPRSTENARGDLMITDTRLAVIRLNDCPNARMSTQSFDREVVPSRGGRWQRFVRREVLSMRNDLLRGNPLWRTYEGTRWVVGAMVQQRRRVLAGRADHTTPSVQPTVAAAPGS